MMTSFLIIYDNDKLAKLGIYLELDKLVVKLSHQANFTLIVSRLPPDCEFHDITMGSMGLPWYYY